MNLMHTQDKAALSARWMRQLTVDGPRRPPAMDGQGSPAGYLQADGEKSSWFVVLVHNGYRAAAILGSAPTICMSPLWDSKQVFCCGKASHRP